MNNTNEEAVKILGKYRNIIYPIVDKAICDSPYPTQFIIPKKYKKISDFHWKMLGDYPARKGKYVRSTLIILICGAMGGNTKDTYYTAASMQLSEDWMLIHDDFEDNSKERRGKPALHKIYGNELSVNAGDAIHVLMWKTLLNNQNIISDKISKEILQEFSTMLTRTTLGQTAELNYIKNKTFDFDEEDYLFIVDGKTSYYSVAGPMRLGGIIAGASIKQLSILTDFGKILGRAYQIKDDILDVSGDFAGQKKQKGNDIFEGKMTLILSHLIKNIRKNEKNKLLQILHKNRENKTQQEVDWVISKMEEYDSISYAEQKTKEYVDTAKEMLNTKLSFLSIKPFSSELNILLDFILRRDH